MTTTTRFSLDVFAQFKLSKMLCDCLTGRKTVCDFGEFIARNFVPCIAHRCQRKPNNASCI